MIKVIEESNKNIFETAVNELIKEGYHIGDSRCGNKYSAILIKRDEKSNYIKIPTLSNEQIEKLKKYGMIGTYEGEIVKVEPLLTKIKTVEEIMKETGSMYVNKRTEEIVTKVNEIIEFLNNKEFNKEVDYFDIRELTDIVRSKMYTYITQQSK